MSWWNDLGRCRKAEEEEKYCSNDAEKLFEEGLAQTKPYRDQWEPSEENIKPKVENVDVWVNVEFLKMALELEKIRSQKKIFYVDVGMLPKIKGETLIKNLRSNIEDEDGDYWVPRREGRLASQVEVIESRVNLDDVLDTAQKLRDFATK